MTSRRGRKRRKGRREPNGRLQRHQSVQPDRGTDEMQQLRLATTGDRNLSPDYPLSILLGRGLITPVQHDAGMRFARLYWGLFGKPFGKTQDYQQARGGEISEGAEAHARREYELLVDELAKHGAVGMITDIAVFLRRGWLIDAILRGDNRHRRHSVRLQRIREALDAVSMLMPAVAA